LITSHLSWAGPSPNWSLLTFHELESSLDVKAPTNPFHHVKNCRTRSTS